MSVFEAATATALVATLLYLGDRGMAFTVCSYNSIAAGGRFRSEDAHKAMHNPFLRWPRIALGVTILIGTFLLALRGGMPDREEFVAVSLFASCLAYGVTSWAYATKAFRDTPQGKALAEAVEKGHWPEK